MCVVSCVVAAVQSKFSTSNLLLSSTLHSCGAFGLDVIIVWKAVVLSSNWTVVVCRHRYPFPLELYRVTLDARPLPVARLSGGGRSTENVVVGRFLVPLGLGS